VDVSIVKHHGWHTGGRAGLECDQQCRDKDCVVLQSLGLGDFGSSMVLPLHWFQQRYL
jgi:hypothetical protein